MGICFSCHYVAEVEQLRVITPSTEYTSEPGAGFKCLPPFFRGTLEHGVVVSEREFVEIRNIRTGAIRVQHGAGLVFLAAFERFSSGDISTTLKSTVAPLQQSVVLNEREYVLMTNTRTGELKLQRGPGLIRLAPYERLLDATTNNPLSITSFSSSSSSSSSSSASAIRPAVVLNELEYVEIVHAVSGQIRLERGPGLVFPALHESMNGDKRKAIALNEKQFVEIANTKTGEIRMVRGPALEFLRLYETAPKGTQNAISLTPDQYVVLKSKKTGEIRVERGEKLVFPLPFEESPLGVQSVIVIDMCHACLVRNIRTGLQTLMTAQQMYVPAPDEEVLDRAQELLVLKEYEVVVLISPKGQFVFMHGWIKAESSFYVPPYHEILTHRWTKPSFRKVFTEGRPTAAVPASSSSSSSFSSSPSTSSSNGKNVGKSSNNNSGSGGSAAAEVMNPEDVHEFQRIDVRHRFMPYAFVVRSHDHVEIVLDIVVGWTIKNVEAMVNKTSNVWHDIVMMTRSNIIEKVAKQSFKKFMEEVNAVVEDAVLHADRAFYEQRGIELTSVQVEGYSCKDERTERVMQETVQETTNKMNRILKQETANEVVRVEMEGRIREEELKKRVLEIQYEHTQLVARTEGEQASKRIRAFIENVGDQLSLEQKVELFVLLEKKESIRELAMGTGITLFCAPNDVNLNLAAYAISKAFTSPASTSISPITASTSAAPTATVQQQAMLSMTSDVTIAKDEQI